MTSPLANASVQIDPDLALHQPRRPEYDERGVSGTRASGGRLWEYEHNKDLLGADWIAEADQMVRSDPVIFAASKARRDTQLTASWRFQVQDDWPDDAKRARDFLHENFGLEGARGRLRYGWEGTLGRILRYQDVGYRYLELIWKPEDGKVWVDFADREPSAHRYWLFDAHGHLTGVLQWIGATPAATRWTGELKPIPVNKLVIFVQDQTGDNFEGLGTLRPCRFWYKLKLHVSDQLAVGTERWAVPTPKITTNKRTLDEQGYTPEQQREMLDNAKASAKAYLSHESGYLAAVEGIDFDVFGSGAFDGTLPKDAIQECDRQILTAFSLQFLLLGVNDTGSRAVGDVQASFFRRTIINGLDLVAAVVGGADGPVAQLLRWNFPALEPRHYPRLVHEGLDPGPLLDMISSLGFLVMSGGLTPDNGLENTLRKQMRAPSLPPEYERDPVERLGAGGAVGAAASMFSELRKQGR